MISKIQLNHLLFIENTPLSTTPPSLTDLASSRIYLPKGFLNFFEKRHIRHLELEQLKLEYKRRNLLFAIEKAYIAFEIALRRTILKNISHDTKTCLRKKYQTLRKKHKNPKKASIQRKTELNPKSPTTSEEAKETNKKSGETPAPPTAKLEN